MTTERPRVEVIDPFCGLAGMRVCAVKGATDEEILATCNSENLAGTRGGWSLVVRARDVERRCDGPVTCADDENRQHLIVLC